MPALPFVIAIVAVFSGRYHALWNDSPWVLLPLFGIACCVALAGIVAAEMRDLQKPYMKR